eukprot:9018750-Pyramimonas_sp.AAC.1
MSVNIRSKYGDIVGKVPCPYVASVVSESPHTEQLGSLGNPAAILLHSGKITSFYGSSCANGGKGALYTPETLCYTPVIICGSGLRADSDFVPGGGDQREREPPPVHQAGLRTEGAARGGARERALLQHGAGAATAGGPGGWADEMMSMNINESFPKSLK